MTLRFAASCLSLPLLGLLLAGCPDDPIDRDADSSSVAEVADDVMVPVDGTPPSDVPADLAPEVPALDADVPPTDTPSADAPASDTVADTSQPLPPNDPGRAGPYPVGYVTTVIEYPAEAARVLPGHIWYPAAGFDAEKLATYKLGGLGPLTLEQPSAFVQDNVDPATDGPFRLIIFSHGYNSVSLQSVSLCERLASHGFVVVSVEHKGNTAADEFDGTTVPREEAAADRPRDVAMIIATMKERSEGAVDLLSGVVNTAEVGVTGHSYGGYTALAAATGRAASGALPHPSVKAVAPITPGAEDLSDDDMKVNGLPTLFIGGTLDVTTPIDPSITRPWGLMTGQPRYHVDVKGATHTHFANICAISQGLIDLGLTPDTWESLGAGQLVPLYEVTCAPDAYPVTEAQRLQSLYAVAFFRTHLAGDASYAGWLRGAYASACEDAIIYEAVGVDDTPDVPLCSPSTVQAMTGDR